MSEHFVNCDWGTTHFRVRAIRLPGAEIVAEFRTDEGVAHIAAQDPQEGRPERFRAVLTAGLETLRTLVGATLDGVPVLISGMAGSSLGWQELPYASLPLSLDGRNLVWHQLPSLCDRRGANPVILISGARAEADVMRGEETQVLGVFQLEAARSFSDSALLIMPGTHSKHIQINAGQIVDFQTFMTGELFDVLSKHSILRHSMANDPDSDDRMASDSLVAFRSGVEESQQLPLSAALFHVRTRQVLAELPRTTNRAFLNGLLIGSEIGYLSCTEFAHRGLILCAGPLVQRLYQTAFEILGWAKPLVSIPAADIERLSALGQALLLPH